MAKVHLIDASPYIFRAYFSIPSSMTGPDGNPVNAVYGFTNFLIRFIKDEAPTHLGIAFDESLTTSFRNEIYPEYKAQRDLPPAELEAQLEACRSVADAFGAVTWADDRYEADDLIGTACAILRKKGHGVCVVSSDKDLAQLVDEECELLDYAKEQRYGPAEVLAKFGVRPDQLVDFLALAGDSVDNIPGVKGVGPKTAVALLNEFGDLDSLYAGLDRIAELSFRGAKTMGEKLERERESAFLSRELATIAVDAPARTDLRELRLTGASREAVEPLFEMLGFGSVLDRVPQWA